METVSISDDGSLIVIGASNANSGGISNAGAAYIFIRSGTTWTQQSILSASNKNINAYFGWSVSITGDSSRIVIGAYQADPGGTTDAGAAYVFH